MTKLMTPNGKLTPQAFKCGYVERFTKYGITFKIEWRSCCYVISNTTNGTWTTARTLTEARNATWAII